MKKVLIIAYYFPPAGMGGVLPIVKLCKYLPRFGWTPVVLTVKDIEYFAYDTELLQEVTCQVFRTESIDPLRLANILSLKSSGRNFEKRSRQFKKLSDFLFIPDNKIGWLPFAISEGIRIINEKNIDVILPIAPPYTSLLVGYFLKKICHIPLICDFRDRWPLSPYLTSFHLKSNEFLKKKIIALSDKITLVSEDIKANLLLTCSYKAKDINIISHGFDPDDFQTKPQKRKEKFTITHTGAFVKGRTPLYFLQAITNLITAKKIPRDDLNIEFTGFYTNKEEEIVKKLNLEDLVHFHSYISRREFIQYLLSTDILWLMLDKEEEVTLPGKIGEYFGAQKPILATVMEGPCAELIRRTQTGTVVSPRDISAIENAIYDFYIKFKNNKLKLPQNKEIEQFNWINLAQNFTKIFDAVTS